MTLGVHVSSREAPPSAGAPTDTGQWFLVGQAEQGTTRAAVLCTSLSAWVAVFGARSAANDKAYDNVDNYFREGGSRLYFVREVGPAAVKATVNIPGASGTSIVATALDAGTVANGWYVTATTASGGFVLKVFDAANNVLDTSPTLADKTAAAAYVNPVVAYTAGAGSTTPTLGATHYALATGASDNANVNDTTLDAALLLFVGALGPGQVSALAPGAGVVRTGTGPYGKLYAHAAANNRFAVCGVTDTPTLATLTALVATVPVGLESYGALFGPSVVIPGNTATGGTPRTIAALSSVAALCARVDATGNPNQAAAGRDLPLNYATGFTQTYSDADHDTLLTAGVNLFKAVFGVLENYGFQTTLTQAADAVYWQANRSRTRMYITAAALSIGEHYMFKDIDGRGLLATAFGTDIAEVLQALYHVGGLYGATPQEAYRVDVGPTVNTDATIAAGQLRAVASVRYSAHAKDIELELVSVPVAQSV